jgi:hypothetical protein
MNKVHNQETCKRCKSGERFEVQEYKVKQFRPDGTLISDQFCSTGFYQRLTKKYPNGKTKNGYTWKFIKPSKPNVTHYLTISGLSKYI